MSIVDKIYIIYIIQIAILSFSLATFFIIQGIIMPTNQTATLDASGLNCPMPILKAKKALSKLSSGETLGIISTDVGSVKDFETFCEQTGHTLVSFAEAGGKYEFIIQAK